MRKIVSTVLIGLLCVFISLTIITISNYFNNIDKKISNIYLYESSFGAKYSEHIYDLENKKYWNFESTYNNVRDEESDDQGYTFVTEISDNKIKWFLNKAALYNIINWQENYVNIKVDDGYLWGFVVTFANGSKKEIVGNYRYPVTYKRTLKVLDKMVE